jgi:hypothetical protein
MAISANHTKFVYPDYISPLPAEDLVKVALHKQQMFDQGVAKVQSQLDNYSQLRSLIPTEIEQQYFDETMTKLVQAVNSSAGLDFSKTANVQSVLNIGKPLEKDTNIINAVKNGRQIQKRYQTLSELDKSKRSPTNDWAYLNDIEAYKKANKLGISLQDKEYDEYFDISEMVTKFVKELSPLEQQEFIGQTKKTPQGYLEVLTEQGFNQKQLADRIRGMLSTNPKAARQLQIDTEYYYNRMGPERAYQAYIGDQTEKAAAITDQVQKTEQQLATLKQSNARVNSPLVQQEIKKVENDLKLFKQYEAVALQNSAKRFEEFNPRDYFETYQNQFVTNLANTYSVQKVNRDLKDDKIWDVLQKRQMEYLKFDLDIKKEKIKEQMTALNPSKSLEEKIKLYKLYNVDPEDVVNVPNFFAPTKDSKGNPVFDFDNERITVGELINDSKSVVDRVPLGGPKLKYNVPSINEQGVFEVKAKELTKKDFMKEFFKSLEKLRPNNILLITTTSGETKEITTEGFKNLKASDLGYIANIAISTPYSDLGETSYKRRRRD